MNESTWLRIEKLNDIASKILKDILAKLVLERKLGQLQPASTTIYQSLGDNEFYLLNKIYKYNLELFYQFTIKSPINASKELNDQNDPYRFAVNFVELRSQNMKMVVKLDKRQIHQVIENNMVIILKVLKNLVKVGSDTYPQYFQ